MEQPQPPCLRRFKGSESRVNANSGSEYPSATRVSRGFALRRLVFVEFFAEHSGKSSNLPVQTRMTKN
jgi:hypothetical protein